jgi:hypothetical protein
MQTQRLAIVMMIAAHNVAPASKCFASSVPTLSAPCEASLEATMTL